MPPKRNPTTNKAKKKPISSTKSNPNPRSKPSKLSQDPEDINSLRSLLLSMNKQIEAQNQYFIQIQKDNETIHQKLQSLHQKVKQYSDSSNARIQDKSNLARKQEKDNSKIMTKGQEVKKTIDAFPSYHGYTNKKRKNLSNKEDETSMKEFYTTKSPPFNNHRYTNSKVKDDSS